MAKKESMENPFAEFIKVLEAQKEELEKITKPFLESQKQAQEMTKPVIEYQQRLFQESMELQKALMENIMETSRKMLRVMSESPMRRAGSAGAGMGLAGDQFSEYVRSMQKIQENWMDQLKSTTEMFQEFIKKASESR